MSMLLDPGTVAPSERDAQLAKESSRALSHLRAAPASAKNVRLRVKAADLKEETVEIPISAFRLLTSILNQMAMGNAVAIIPIHAELTTQQAAEILNVSRPFVIKLINDKQLPCKLVGTHRRVLFKDLMDYKNRIDSDRLQTLDELAAQAQELNLGY